MEGFSFPLKVHENLSVRAKAPLLSSLDDSFESNHASAKKLDSIDSVEQFKKFSNQITDSCDSKHVDYVQRIYLTTTTCTSFESGRTVRSTV